MDDLIFKCEHCEQELSVDASGAGTEIECPSCGEAIVIPQHQPDSDSEDDYPPSPVIASSAEAKEERHFTVPHHEAKPDPLIAKPLKPLKAAAHEGVQLRIKTFKRAECVEVGKDHFDEVVSEFLDEVGEANVISVSPLSYAHQDLASSTWIDDYGVLIFYKG